MPRVNPKPRVNRFKLKAALAQLDEQGIQVGDTVKASWTVDQAYGGGTHWHTGTLASLDRESGWFEITGSPNSPGHLRTVIYGITMEKAKANPFMKGKK